MVTKVIARGGTEFGVERTDTRVRIENKLNGLVVRIERVANELLSPIGESYDSVFVKRDEGFRILEHKRYGGDKDSNKTNTLGIIEISHARDKLTLAHEVLADARLGLNVFDLDQESGDAFTNSCVVPADYPVPEAVQHLHAHMGCHFSIGYQAWGPDKSPPYGPMRAGPAEGAAPTDAD